MARFLRFAVVVGAFSAGLALAWWHSQPERRLPMLQHSAASEEQEQITVLQQHIRSQERELETLRQRVQTLSTPLPLSVLPSAAVATAPPALPETQRLRRQQRPQTTPVRLDAAEGSAVVTVTDVRNRLQQHLAETEGLGLGARQQRLRELGEALRQLGEPALTALLQELEESDSAQARRAAATLLGALQDLRALPALQDILEHDEDVVLRRAAARGLQLLQQPATIPVLATLLDNSQEDRFVRLSAAYGLAQLGDVQGVRGLVQIFDEAAEDGQGRMLAFRSLMILSDPEALPLMRQLTVSATDVSYRLAAIRFLTEWGDQAALPLLQQVMRSSHEQPAVVEAAARAHTAIMMGQRPPRSTGEQYSRDSDETGTPAPGRRR